MQGPEFDGIIEYQAANTCGSLVTIVKLIHRFCVDYRQSRSSFLGNIIFVVTQSDPIVEAQAIFDKSDRENFEQEYNRITLWRAFE